MTLLPVEDDRALDGADGIVLTDEDDARHVELQRETLASAPVRGRDDLRAVAVENLRGKAERGRAERDAGFARDAAVKGRAGIRGARYLSTRGAVVKIIAAALPPNPNAVTSTVRSAPRGCCGNPSSASSPYGKECTIPVVSAIEAKAAE